MGHRDRHVSHVAQVKTEALVQQQTAASTADSQGCTKWAKQGRGTVLSSYKDTKSLTGLYKFETVGGDKVLYVEDASPVFVTHLWMSNNISSVKCATMDSPKMKPVGSDALFSGKGVGKHTPGYLNGWILWHWGNTYNIDGNHPCAIAGASGKHAGGPLTEFFFCEATKATPSCDGLQYK